MKFPTFSQNWDLDVLFMGGSHSPAFQDFLNKSEKDLSAFQQYVEAWQLDLQDTDRFYTLLEMLKANMQQLEQASSFVSCLQAQDTSDSKAGSLRAKVSQLLATYGVILTTFDEKLRSISDREWQQLLEKKEFSELQFFLTERRKHAKEKLSKAEESLIHSLSVDGYHGWGEIYDTLASHVYIPFVENGETNMLSVGQASNLFNHPNRAVRKEVFHKWEEAWGEKTDMLADILNHLAGFRLTVYKARGWEDVLKEPLAISRMKKETLDTMWHTIADFKAPLVRFLNKKAEMLGIKKLSWFDVEAPIGNTNSTMTFDEGAEFIISHFNKFGPQLADLAKTAFKNRWIEAEDRPGKRAGGFCTSFPLSEQSRIFMTYSGTPSNVSTLAHELGHAFHSAVLHEIHPLKRNYAMNVAETASTFAEMVIADAAVKQAASKEEKLVLLEDKIQRSVALLMNIHARFLFETAFYEERKAGYVHKERLNELMIDAQKTAYGDALGQYHPQFWSSKLHFYITDTPFYNFPYTFGYLFSLGIYAKAMEAGAGYEKKYIALLQDTASMTVEELAKKHLDVDLTKRDFWEAGLKLCIEDIEEFLALLG
ncbi:M3 family oligoendopeptidase [Heyndrickxia ginsengihumi]|uniref:Oligoendopeptidase n=1 Tax=Heyndrickxia ginsengihumi TaxID=363870 RepID=A0A0A6VJP3_9BACI|nr:M3 family oligoendopeptidase [Heyndrickxia ginsengihumi]KHD86819.1 oligoendopeptidase [Heyndrickxia ginsengihumi]NEY19743.1 M3 family oligoendopeptidase [Heyndrickxia ginsengihumi]